MNRGHALLAGVLSLSAAACAPRVECPQRAPAAPAARTVLKRVGRTGLVNPLLDVLPEQEFAELRPFERKVAAEAERLMRAKMATKIAVFWQDLDNGQLFSMNANDAFAPASLLKVPLLIAVLKASRSDPSLLERRVPYVAAPSSVEPEIPAEGSALKPGELYAVDELLEAMIARSDNGAALALYNAVGDAPLQEVYRDLGITIPQVRGPEDTINVREYSALFRILYNASYLGKERSERALEHLTRSHFAAGLVAGTPKGMTIAHKFGERTVDGQRQLHDCGIIYEPGEPYILCVMTRGTRFDDLAGTISRLSALVYAEVHAQIAAPR